MDARQPRIHDADARLLGGALAAPVRRGAASKPRRGLRGEARLRGGAPAPRRAGAEGVRAGPPRRGRHAPRGAVPGRRRS